MPLRRWFMLIAVCAGCGIVQVAWRSAVIAKSYQLAEGMRRLQQAQTEVGRLTTQVAALESPVHLAEVAARRQLQLVAWSTLSPQGAE